MSNNWTLSECRCCLWHLRPALSVALAGSTSAAAVRQLPVWLCPTLLLLLLPSAHIGCSTVSLFCLRCLRLPRNNSWAPLASAHVNRFHCCCNNTVRNSPKKYQERCWSSCCAAQDWGRRGRDSSGLANRFVAAFPGVILYPAAEHHCQQLTHVLRSPREFTCGEGGLLCPPSASLTYLTIVTNRVSHTMNQVDGFSSKRINMLLTINILSLTLV